jgi:hypothetical protein
LDPLVGPLTSNSGPTWTHALLPGSPAIDAGSWFGVPLTDQRGQRRVVCCASDIGAFEVQECTDCLAPVITSVAPDADRTPWVYGNGQPNVSYTLQMSTNLQHWSDRTNFVTDPLGLFGLGDPFGDLAVPRFYRLRNP